MRIKLAIVVAINCLLACLCPSAQSQEKQEEKLPPAKIEQLKWIAGHWQGEALGGRFEETWNPPLGDTMVGMFKSLNGESVRFYELLTIGPKGDSLALRLKHFGPDLVGWEEKDKSLEFPLISVTSIEAKFDGLTFRKINDEEMHIIVQVGDASESRELTFECHRVKATGRAGDLSKAP